jgi:thymidylate synthase
VAITGVVTTGLRRWVFFGTPRDGDASGVCDAPYLALLQDLVDKHTASPACLRSNRTLVDSVSVFGRQVRFCLKNGAIPMLTTKRVPFKHMVEELLWFCRGETDATILSKKGIKIWNGNSSREFLDARGLVAYAEGDIGPGYGFQWRHMGATYRGAAPGVKYADSDGFDQLAYVERELRTNPTSRRILLNAWNSADLDKMALPPCHVMAQWYVEPATVEPHGKPTLSCMLTMRSCDTFLGLPWNMASYATLTHILAARCGMQSGELVVSIGDCHLYSNCIEQAGLQLKRTARPTPKLLVNNGVATKEWAEISVEDLTLCGYCPHPSIRADMAV